MTRRADRHLAPEPCPVCGRRIRRMAPRDGAFARHKCPHGRWCGRGWDKTLCWECIRRTNFGVGSISPPTSVPRHDFLDYTATNPFRMEGHYIKLEIQDGVGLTAATADHLQAILTAALEQDGTFMAVSGAFRSPYTSPSNVLPRLRRYDGTEGPPRGSEDYCVWAYYTLKDEGRLEGAQIPDWFLPEGWLERYRKESPSQNL